MTFSDLIKFALIGLVLYIGWLCAKPYYDNYWFSKEVEKAATMCTKETVEKTRLYLTQVMREEGIQKSGEDCFIQKDYNGVVTVSCEYEGMIDIFGLYKKPVKFIVREVKTTVENRMF